MEGKYLLICVWPLSLCAGPSLSKVVLNEPATVAYEPLQIAFQKCEHPLDYEESSERHLSITIENEKPYFTCQVKRKTSIGPWEVINSVATPLSKNFTIMVEDANDPPAFTETVKEVWVEENKETGYPLGSLFAKDPDRFFSSDITYMKGGDPGDWVNVNLQTCEITTARTLDRESVHVVNNTYTVTVYAVDKGRPPLTGTGTLIIHILDQNDELPQLKESALSMCLSDRPTTATVSAFDLDEHPHSGPFRFELLGDVKEEWDISPTHGTTVNLSMKSRAYTGLHQLQLKVYDLEGSFSLQTLSVTVCDCSVTPTCMTRASASTGVSGSATVIMLFASLVLLGLLLMAISVSCKRRMFQIIKEDPNESWLSFNVENPGTDCEVPCLPLLMQADNLPMENRLGQVIQKGEPPDFKSPRNNYLPVNGGFTKEDEALWSLLGQVLQYSLTDCQELSDYNPRVYAYEGDLSPDAELESICTDEEEANFSPLDLLELDRKFIKLAEILIPHPALR
ncbi:cadherin-1-like [Anguilla anguilla]|uniref:cadherin-1-like n=1 Tax=Anguilla anguilla TaxID=7936 RepID=UPI0015A8F3CB|nr:cadherin-1-like [Anguilla anguilla]